jgi:hypothetical protein
MVNLQWNNLQYWKQTVAIYLNMDKIYKIISSEWSQSLKYVYLMNPQFYKV